MINAAGFVLAHQYGSCSHNVFSSVIISHSPYVPLVTGKGASPGLGGGKVNVVQEITGTFHSLL